MKKKLYLIIIILVLVCFLLLLRDYNHSEAPNYGETVEESTAVNVAENVLKLVFQPNLEKYEKYVAGLDHVCAITTCSSDFTEHDKNRIYLSDYENLCTENCMKTFLPGTLPVFVDYLVDLSGANVSLTGIQLVLAEETSHESKNDFYYTVTMEADGKEFDVSGQINLSRNTNGEWQVFSLMLSDAEALGIYITGENVYAVEAFPINIQLAGNDAESTGAFYAESDWTATPIELTQISKENNGISFVEEWAEENQWELPVVRTFEDEAYIYEASSDGTVTIYDKKTKDPLYIVSEFADQWTWHTNFAKIRDDILYIGKMYNGYAHPNSSYMMAYDLKEQKLLWRSEDQTYNSGSFVLIGDVIICGYGFTDEPDYLYQIDANTGRVIDKIELSKMADCILEKDGKLYIHTYSYDYVFEIGKLPVKNYPLDAQDVLEVSKACGFPQGWNLIENDMIQTEESIATSYSLKAENTEVYAGHKLGLLSRKTGENRGIGVNASSLDNVEDISLEECKQVILFTTRLFGGFSHERAIYDKVLPKLQLEEEFELNEEIEGMYCQIQYNPKKSAGKFSVAISDSYELLYPKQADLGITLTVKNVTPTGITLVVTQEGEDSSELLQMSGNYTLEVLDGETWKDVSAIEGATATNVRNQVITRNTTTEFDINWEKLYGSLNAGTYRIHKWFYEMKEDNSGMLTAADYTVEFKVK